MKRKILLAVMCLIACFNCAVKANSVNIRIINNSDFSIYGSSSAIHNGSFFINDHGEVSKSEVKKGSTAEFSTGNADAFCGTDGYVFYKTTVNGKDYMFCVRFDVPYIGDNDFYYSAEAPFRMKHIVGGPGSNVTITFELTGGPVAVDPPAPPFDLPTSGPSWITGSINWNLQAVGMPTGNIANAFEFEVIAPSRFYPNYPASKDPSFTEGTVSPESGTLTDYKPLPNIKVEVNEAEKVSSNPNMAVSVYSMKLNFMITNLPKDIPLEVRIKPKTVFWKPGTTTPAQPSGSPNSKWCVYAKKIRADKQSATFSVNGMWMNNDGTAAGGNNATGLARQELSKVRCSIQSDAVITGNDLNSIIQTAGIRPVQRSTKLTAPLKNNVKVKMNKPL